jgi:hypothetical protein
VLPGMRVRGAGAVVMLSSVAAWASVPPGDPVLDRASSPVTASSRVLRRSCGQRGAGALVNPLADRDDYLARARGPVAPARRPATAAGARVSCRRGSADAVLDAADAGRRPRRSVPRRRRAGAARAGAAGGALLDVGVRPVRPGRSPRRSPHWCGSRHGASPRR